MALLNSVISWIMKKRMHQIELFIKYPHDVQQEWFKTLLYRANDTEWGRQYDYKSIQTVEQYRERVPISNYEDLKPFIDRTRAGEQNILWPTDIKWYAKSSGTTAGKSKFIPVSKHAIEECHFKGGKDLLSLYINSHPESLIFDGKSIAMGGSNRIIEVNNEAYYEGDLSAILIQNLPFWVEMNREPNLAVALMEEWEEKIEKMGQITMQLDVTTLAGVPSWIMVLIKKVMELSGEENIKKVWPNFEVFFWGGVNFEPYRKQFNQLFGNEPVNFWQTYNASEGFFGIQDRKGADDLLLMLDYGVFYEFMPMDQLNKETPKTIGLNEVKLDVNYALIISTNAGLWRYKIGDTIVFTSLDPFRIKVSGRTKNFINAVGEEVIMDNADKAIAIACEKCKASVNEYTAGPVYSLSSNSACHEWIFEFEKEPSNLAVFADSLDNALKSLNSDYEAKRYRNMILNEPLIHVAPQGTFYKWLKMNNKLGGQHKVPRLVNGRKYLNEILEVMKGK
ncbi:MAG: GH3 auxin-responsive promoter family protein [Bacteroidales bacterium]|nr:GH3 auxin-responsive promoter family protein [Bacteroidales bacterium]